MCFSALDHFLFLISFFKVLKFIFRKKRKEEERGGEKHHLVASHMHPNQGLGTQPRHVS